MTQAMWGRLLQEVENMEERLETMKLSGSPPSLSSIKRTLSIVQRTAGILGKRFPSGVAYQRRIRRAWEHGSRARTGCHSISSSR